MIKQTELPLHGTPLCILNSQVSVRYRMTLITEAPGSQTLTSFVKIIALKAVVPRGSVHFTSSHPLTRTLHFWLPNTGFSLRFVFKQSCVKTHDFFIWILRHSVLITKLRCAAFVKNVLKCCISMLSLADLLSSYQIV